MKHIQIALHKLFFHQKWIHTPYLYYLVKLPCFFTFCHHCVKFCCDFCRARTV